MNPVYGYVRDRIVKNIEDAIKNGTKLTWVKPWSEGGKPMNWAKETEYHGINLVLLEPGEYITWTQICDEKKKNPAVHLKEGATKYMVTFWKMSRKKVKNEKGEEEEEVKPILRYFTVYNIRDVEGLEPKRHPKTFEHDPIDEAERISSEYVTREGIRLSTDGESAYYRPSTDEVVVPNISRFKERGEYYSALFHELTHSTGHSKRLNRLNSTAFFGSQDYSKEELIAEMGAAMLCAEVGIADDTVENSTAYLQGWLSAIKNGDPTMLVSAAGKAQKAVDYIIGEEEKNDVV